MRRSLTDELTATLAEQIEGGAVLPGAKLPTGQELALAHGVSLSVVREALSRLMSDGLVTSRQGAGVFVAENSPQRPFRIAGAQAAPTADIFELRMGVEVMAAALAAERRTEAHIAKLDDIIRAMQAAVDEGRDAVAEDLAFHREIARATGNSLFERFIDFLGTHIQEAIATSREAGNLAEVQAAIAEHRAIFAAIRDRSASAAQTAMTAHMVNCQSRCSS